MNKSRKALVFLIYGIGLVYLVFKAFFYFSEVDMAPDVAAHLSYLYYEYQHPFKLIPTFEQIPMLALDVVGDKAYIVEQTSNICYLGHPPVYYRLLALLGCVRQDNSGIYLDMLRLCVINVGMVCFGLMLCLEYGRLKIEKEGDSLLAHILFVSIVVNTPLISYLAGYATNDNLLYLALGITIWGLEWGIQGARGYKTYWTIAAGLCLAVLTKLTLGLILLIAVVLTALYVMIQEKSIRLLRCKEFASTLVLYAVPCVYFLHQKLVYGSVQPGLARLSPETHARSIWAVSSGITRTFAESVYHYWSNFWDTWTRIYSHYITQDKEEIFADMVYGSFVLFFLGFTVYQLVKLLRGKLNSKYLVVVAVNMGAVCAMMKQFASAIDKYMSGGNGGYSARYYACCIVIFALSAVLPVNAILNKKNVNRGCVIATKLIMVLAILGWIYYDFFYFLTSFSMYREFL